MNCSPKNQTNVKTTITLPRDLWDQIKHEARTWAVGLGLSPDGMTNKYLVAKLREVVENHNS